MRRVKKTRQQVGLSGDGRARNVAGAFAVDIERLARRAGRRVVLIDDVYTTGATCKAVVRALKKGGVEHIDVMSFARCDRSKNAHIVTETTAAFGERR
ncbi:phosphoribosyltransferase family protein [Devosia sp. A8/3-2]|nr:phosphoribosyltransferase family protein [Devosia sp. A8/3-2]